MSLDLKDFFPRISKDLDRAWFVILGNTSKEGTSSIHGHQLRNVNPSLKPQLFLAIFNLFDRLISPHRVERGLNVRLISHTGEIHILERELVLRICLLFLPVLWISLLGMQVPLTDSAVPPTGYKPGIIIQPLYAPDLA